jgi:hypothetical protein
MRTDRYTGPPSSISDLLRAGVSHVQVCCENPRCFNWANIDLRGLKLAGDLAAAQIPRYRKFVCSRCGNQKVSIWRVPLSG